MTQIVNYPVIDLLLIAYKHKNICDALDNASKDCIPSGKVDFYKEHIVYGKHRGHNYISKALTILDSALTS